VKKRPLKGKKPDVQARGNEEFLPVIPVIIPVNFTNKLLERNYFYPRFIKILKGQVIEWINQDSSSHHLEFYEVKSKVIRLFDLGVVESGQRTQKRFDFDGPRIEYFCRLHRNESGTIVIFPKPERQMSNTEQLRFLSRTFNIKPPSTLSHLKS
jgi:hypothetical protein